MKRNLSFPLSALSSAFGSHRALVCSFTLLPSDYWQRAAWHLPASLSASFLPSSESSQSLWVLHSGQDMACRPRGAGRWPSLLSRQTFRSLPPRAWLKCLRFYLIFFCASRIMNVAHYLWMTDNLEGKKQRKGDTQDCYCLIRCRQTQSISTTLIPSWVLELHGQIWISTEINRHFKKTLKGLSGPWWAFPSVRKEERLKDAETPCPHLSWHFYYWKVNGIL